MLSTTSSSPDLALIGAGYWGRNLARNFRELGVLHTLCDASESILSGYTDDYAGVRKVRSTDLLWEDPAITRVAIAAPAVQHFELARTALKSGKDVFVEKPLCLELGQASELVELSHSHGRILMVGHLLQYHPCIEKLRELVSQGVLGRLHYITSNRLNLGKIRREENALWSFAPHDLSVILALVGTQIPDQVRCVGEGYLTQGVADTTLTTLRFPGAVRAHVHVSWLNPFKEQKLSVVGSHGMAVFDDTKPFGEKLLLYRNHLRWEGGQNPVPAKAPGEPVVVTESEPLQNECRHFLDCCRDRVAPRTDGEEGLRVLQVLQMAQHSLEADGEAVTKDSCSGQGSTNTVAGSVPQKAPNYFVHPSAVVDEGAQIGQGTKIWHFSHVMKGASIGERCVLGQNVNVDGGTRIGNNVKIQNNVSVYTGAEIEDDVFLGPSCVLTNVTNPRSQVNRHSLYETTRIRRGATIGANATIVCGVTIGRYAFIGAGAVVTRDVPDYGLVVGNPGRLKGWMSRHGHKLEFDPVGTATCPESKFQYSLSKEGTVICLDYLEDVELPATLNAGSRPYKKSQSTLKPRKNGAAQLSQ